LLAGFFKYLGGEGAVVFYFFDGTKTTFETTIFSKVYTTCATLTDLLTDLVATTQNLSLIEGESHGKTPVLG
jgi:hypothetical protein